MVEAGKKSERGLKSGGYERKRRWRSKRVEAAMSRASTLPLITFSYEPFSPLFSPAVLRRPFFPEPTQLPRFPFPVNVSASFFCFSVSVQSCSPTLIPFPLSLSFPPFLSPSAFPVHWKNALIRFCWSSLLVAEEYEKVGGSERRKQQTKKKKR